ncbi:MAG: DUF4389 domain-containing protein [Methanobrevibacter sp.]|jgi:hypothetical protein|nr:DUF4389 domain-containing protein [Candidatus Methanovirga australis]
MKEYLVYEEKASRLELFVRIFYSFVLSIVVSLYSLLSSIVSIFQWIVILILGKRSEMLNGIISGFCTYYVSIMSYCYLITDERPGIAPKNMSVFLNGFQYLVYEEKASRLELFVRIFYSFVLIIVAGLYSLLASIAHTFQWIMILILGRRSEMLNEIISGFCTYYVSIMSYLHLITDERPKLVPTHFEISLEIE